MSKVCFYIPTKFEKFLHSDLVKQFEENYSFQEKQIELLKQFFDTIPDMKKKCILMVSFFQECLKDIEEREEKEFIKYILTKQQVMKILNGTICEEFETRYANLLPNTFQVNSSFLMSLVLLHISHYTEIYKIPKMETFIQTLLLNIHPTNTK